MKRQSIAAILLVGCSRVPDAAPTQEPLPVGRFEATAEPLRQRPISDWAAIELDDQRALGGQLFFEAIGEEATDAQLKEMVECIGGQAVDFERGDLETVGGACAVDLSTSAVAALVDHGVSEEERLDFATGAEWLAASASLKRSTLEARHQLSMGYTRERSAPSVSDPSYMVIACVDEAARAPGGKWRHVNLMVSRCQDTIMNENPNGVTDAEAFDRVVSKLPSKPE